MAVTDSKIHHRASVARKYLTLGPVTLGASVTAQVLGKVKISAAFEIVRVSAYARALTGTVSVDVKLGNAGTDTSCLTGAITPTSGSTDPVDGTLTTAVATRRGTAGQVITAYGTTAGASSATELVIVVVYRPRPLNGES